MVGWLCTAGYAMNSSVRSRLVGDFVACGWSEEVCVLGVWCLWCAFSRCDYWDIFSLSHFHFSSCVAVAETSLPCPPMRLAISKRTMRPSRDLGNTLCNLLCRTDDDQHTASMLGQLCFYCWELALCGLIHQHRRLVATPGLARGFTRLPSI